MDIIGIMYSPATVDVEGNEVTPAVPLPGWHVNTPAPVEGWEAHEVFPATPMRVYAGHETHFYAFDSEAQYIEAAMDAGLIPRPAPTAELAD